MGVDVGLWGLMLVCGGRLVGMLVETMSPHVPAHAVRVVAHPKVAPITTLHAHLFAVAQYMLDIGRVDLLGPPTLAVLY